jgi:hypothetical protein
MNCYKPILTLDSTVDIDTQEFDFRDREVQIQCLRNLNQLVGKPPQNSPANQTTVPEGTINTAVS